MLGEAATVTQAEDEPSTSVSTESHETCAPRVLQTHHQHVADYVRLMMEEGEILTLGEDRPAPLITEVHCFFPCLLLLILHYLFFSIVLHNYHLISGIAKDLPS